MRLLKFFSVTFITAILICAEGVVGITRAAASQPGPAGPPWAVPLAPAVREQLNAAYLTADEAKDLRIRHGAFVASDLDTPARQARAAIIRGNFTAAALSDQAADVLDRAEAALLRGEIATVLELTAIADGAAAAAVPARLIRLRASAFELSGQPGEAIKLAARAVQIVRSGKGATAFNLAEAVRASAMYYRLAGTASAETDFGRLMAALAEARRLDPSEPLVPMVEAEILLDRDNFAQAQEALRAAMGLRVESAEAIALLGNLLTSAFDISGAERVAAHLDELAAMQFVAGEGNGGPEVQLPPGQEVAPGLSLASALLRARAMLRQNDPDLAEAGIAPALAVMPKAPALLAMQAAISGVRYDFAGAEKQFAAFDAIHPKAPQALLVAGKALAEARQYQQAAVWLKRAVELAPYWNQPAVELGLLYVQSGQDEDAQLVLEKAFKLDPFNVRADNSLRLLKQLRGFDRTTGEHFVIRSRPGVDTLLAQEMLPLLESMHAVVTGGGIGLLHTPDQKTFIDLMPGHQQFAVRIAGIPRIHTIAASTGPVIAMESPRDGKGSTGTYDWLRVVRHEYTHTVGLSKTNNRIPHWFTEAQAVYLEQGPRDMRTAELLTRALTTDTLFDFTDINLAFTRPKKPTDRAQAYAQGHWMYQFIVKTGGEDAPRKLMEQYAKGVREAEAFEAVLGKSRDEFFVEFLTWAKAEVVSWGMLPKGGQPTIKELMAELEPEPPKPVAPMPNEEPGVNAEKAVDAPDKPAKPDQPVADRGEPAEPMPVVPEAKSQRRKPVQAAEPGKEQVARWLELYPDHPDVLQLAVMQALGARNNKPDEAMRPLLERYAAARPVDGLPHTHLAELDIVAGRPVDAAKHLEFLDAREESSPKIAARLAGLYAQAALWPAASVKAERAAIVAPYVAEYRELAATCSLQMGDFANAERHIRFLIALEPDRAVHKQRLEALEKMRAGK